MPYSLFQFQLNAEGSNELEYYMKKRRGPGKVGIQPICMLLEPSSENNPNKHEMVEEKLYIDKDQNAL